MISKIVTRDEWEAARKSGEFHGAAIDLKDGYIHFSTASQVRETAAKHFADQDGLYLVAIDETVLGDQLKWEPSRGGALFPHLYGTLPFSTVTWEQSLPLSDVDGQSHVFPDEVA